MISVRKKKKKTENESKQQNHIFFSTRNIQREGE
jgi:hypothetical protein